MFEFFKKKLKKQKKEAPPIIQGDVWWSIADNKNPFGKNSWTVEIKAVKDGWVNYKFSPGIIFQNESLKESSFRNCYQPNKP